jgi:hypothetical protein
MGRTKRLHEQVQEEEVRPETVLNDTKTVTKSEEDVKILRQAEFNALLAYLQTKPFAEVNNLIVSLSQAPVVKATITQNGGN